MVGKYEIRSEPLPGSIHMRRYTVFSMGLRIGTMVSLPTESDCLYLENPPSVPPLKPYFFHRPGRPKKGVAPPSIIAAVFEAGIHTVPREDLPEGAPFRGLTEPD